MASRLPDKVKIIRLPAGYQGTVGIVQLLAQLARERSQHPRIRARARELFAGTGMNDLGARLDRLFRFLVDRVTFIGNPVGAQHITDPVRLDEEIEAGGSGECCASIAAYAAAVLAAAGIRSEFEIVGWDKHKPQQFRHVALRVLGPGGQMLPFDPVGAMAFPDSFGVGDSLATDGPVEHWGMDGARLAGLGDTYDDVRSGIDVFQQIAKLVPVYGSIVSDVVQVGEDVYDRVSGSKIGTALNLPGGPGKGAGVTVPAPPPGNMLRVSAATARAVEKVKPTSTSSSTGKVAAAVGIPLAAWLLLA